jgi:NAD(P)-dependent dehydrogenase (short-subunit alcohol dehydrogenase family)
MMGILDGKVAVITGGTSGIGARTAELFAREGATTVIAGRRAAEGEAQAAKLGPKAEFVRADVSVEADVAALITGVAERHGQLDCLMNCAGEGGSPGGIASVDLDRLQRTLAIHLGGAVAGMKYAAPVMAAQRSGSIINVASIGGHIAGWTFLDYSAAKAAVIQLTRCTAAELGQYGVRVNSISPGPILTGIFGKGAGPRPSPGRPRRYTPGAGLPGQAGGLPADRPGWGASRRCGGRAVVGQRRLLVRHRPGSGRRRGDPGRPAPRRLGGGRYRHRQGPAPLCQPTLTTPPT